MNAHRGHFLQNVAHSSIAVPQDATASSGKLYEPDASRSHEASMVSRLVKLLPQYPAVSPATLVMSSAGTGLGAARTRTVRKEGTSSWSVFKLHSLNQLHS